jgi:hypothetical protein
MSYNSMSRTRSKGRLTPFHFHYANLHQYLDINDDMRFCVLCNTFALLVKVHRGLYEVFSMKMNNATLVLAVF